ncbi:MAG: hypothetical protein ABIR06_08795 [Cyclobacteriaceae bacterium]
MFTINTFTIILILIFITGGSCRSAQNKSDQEKTLASLVRQTLGAENEIVVNTSETYALCQQKRHADHFRRKIKYIVVRLSDNTIVREGYFSGGYVKWYNHDSIEVFSSSQSGKEESSTKKIIHVNSQP